MGVRRPKYILVVDDNAQNRSLARAAFEDEGFRVVLAADGEEALRAIQQEPPDCVLMDVRMPRLDGIAACERLRALPGGEEIAVVFVTAHRDLQAFDRAVAAGGDDFLTKPYRPDELVLRVQTAMRARQLAAERLELVVELRRQREQLQRLELQKDQLIAFLVHDLKNPVNSIGLQVEILGRAAERPDRVRTAASRIKDEASALLRMIMNILDIGRASEDRLVPKPEPTDALRLAEHVVGQFNDRATLTGARLSVRGARASMSADPDLLARVLANLVDNALRHAPEQSEVTVSVTDLGREVEFAIADAGPGVPLSERENIFDRFERGSARSDRLNRGLGLAFCKVAVQAHGGRIWVEDARPGAVFRVRLPTQAISA